MNVLVTGGAGYIGSHTCLELLEKGYGVVVIDNLCNSNPKSLERVQELTGKTVKFYEGDVRDEALLKKIFGENEIGCVIHFAGLKAAGESVAMPWLTRTGSTATWMKGILIGESDQLRAGEPSKDAGRRDRWSKDAARRKKSGG